MDNKTLVWLRNKLRARSNKYMFDRAEHLEKDEEGVLEGRIDELEDIIQLIDRELLRNPSPGTLFNRKPKK